MKKQLLAAILFSFASFSRIEIVSFLIKWLQRDGLKVTAQQLTAGQIFYYKSRRRYNVNDRAKTLSS